MVLTFASLFGAPLLNRETTVARTAGVAIGVVGMLPWMWLMFSMIRAGDEFIRRLFLITFGFAFAGVLLLLMTLGLLVRAHFMKPPDLFLVWVVFVLLWLVALLGTKFYFERAR